MSDKRAYLLLSAVVLFWAGNFPLGKLALEELGPLTLTAGRAVLAAPVLVLVARLRAPLAQPLVRRDYLAFLILGLTGLVGNTTLWFWGLKHTTALNAGIIGASSPLFVAVAAAVLLGDRLSARNWLGIGLTVAAVLPEPDALRGDRSRVADRGRSRPRLPPGRRGAGDRGGVPGDAAGAWREREPTAGAQIASNRQRWSSMV